MTPVQLELALKAFRMGFTAGAKAGTHHGFKGTMPTEKHWLRGFEAGRAALASDEHAYRNELAAE